ncbi:unnamed protein product [Ceratitis capitata]|uniref:(Mediterranean fruit fly) hypothetical protein n=1 Tax=Ceratitis capitata TaxID=7213 RepID=A0A811VF16_CERCA|nr:unnamed protein product [Ceratitis capitata]
MKLTLNFLYVELHWTPILKHFMCIPPLYRRLQRHMPHQVYNKDMIDETYKILAMTSHIRDVSSDLTIYILNLSKVDQSWACPPLRKYWQDHIVSRAALGRSIVPVTSTLSSVVSTNFTDNSHEVHLPSFHSEKIRPLTGSHDLYWSLQLVSPYGINTFTYRKRQDVFQRLHLATEKDRHIYPLSKLKFGETNP